jgi:hypothetical protein
MIDNNHDQMYMHVLFNTLSMVRINIYPIHIFIFKLSQIKFENDKYGIAMKLKIFFRDWEK